MSKEKREIVPKKAFILATSQICSQGAWLKDPLGLGSLFRIHRGPAVDTRLVSPHWVTPVVCGDLRVPASQLEVLGGMPRPDGLAELGSGPGGPCNSAVNPLSDEHCLMVQNVFKMQSRCQALLYMQCHERGSIPGRTDSHIHKGTTYSEIALKLTLEGGSLPE